MGFLKQLLNALLLNVFQPQGGYQSPVDMKRHQPPFKPKPKKETPNPKRQGGYGFSSGGFRGYEANGKYGGCF